MFLKTFGDNASTFGINNSAVRPEIFVSHFTFHGHLLFNRSTTRVG